MPECGGISGYRNKYMDFESLKAILQSSDMEEVLAPQSADIFNIFCKKDGEHINTIQTIEDENGRRTISASAYRRLERELSSHHLMHLEHNILIYEGTAEAVPQSQF